jgi:hypothetical protein
MQSARALFLETAANVVAALPQRQDDGHRRRIGLPAPGQDHQQQQALKEATEQAISNRLILAWFIAVIVIFVLSIVLIFTSWFLLSNMKVGIAVSTFLWAVLFGWLFTFVLPAKVVSATFGALFGSGAQDAVTGEGIISAIQGHTGTALKAIGTLSVDALNNEQGFIAAMVWMFFGVIALLCLPSFFRD